MAWDPANASLVRGTTDPKHERQRQQSSSPGAPLLGVVANLTLGLTLLLGLGLGLVLGSGSGCSGFEPLDATKPARGPGQLVGNGDEINAGAFASGVDTEPSARAIEPPALDDELHCDPECRAYCEGLNLQNPVNRGICPQMWGLGITHQPVDELEACRRTYVALIGRTPTYDEVQRHCPKVHSGELASQLIESRSFVDLQRRRWADILMYSHRIVSFERAFDADDLVRKTHEGRVAWDHFATVVSAHPIFVRRYDSPEDRSDALFDIFLGRPPYALERAELSKLYRMWYNGYWEHPYLGIIPDAYVDFRCAGDGKGDDGYACSTAAWGGHSISLTADARAKREEGDQEGMLWSGLLSSEEWEMLQAPGRALTSERAFWEASVDRLLRLYFDYSIGDDANAIRHELVATLVEHEGDIRSVHHAIATSLPFLQSRLGPSELPWPWAHGPQRLLDAETWLASLTAALDLPQGRCDWRLPEPSEFVQSDIANGWTRALIRDASDWELNEDGRVDLRHAELLRSLGGCPRNENGGRFRALSILGTSVQEGFLWRACGLEGAEYGGGGGGGRDGKNNGYGQVEATRLLPEGTSPQAVLSPDTASAILDHLARQLHGRPNFPTGSEALETAVEACQSSSCSNERFARVMCFVLLSGAENALL